MKLIYLSTITIPSPLANRLQTMKMAEAFSQLCDFKLYVGKKLEEDQKIFEYYNISCPFKIIELGIPKLKPRSFFSFPRYLKVIREEKPDIIYIRESHLSFFLSFFSRDLFFEAHSFPKNYFLYSLFFKRLKGIIVITRKLKDFFLRKGIAENKILVAPDAVDIKIFNVGSSMFEARGKLNLPKDKKIVLYTGHLYSWKGADTLAKASEYLPKDTEIYFVGGTESDKRNFQPRTSNFERIKVVGHRRHSEIPYWLKSADVLVLPNTAKEEISKYWTSPIKMFEYMASKRPIVASDLPSIKEILNEDNAILVKPDDPKALAEGIKKVLESPELAERISAKAFQDVQQYTWEKRAEKILGFIQKNL